MFQSRDEVRQVYQRVWQKMQAQQLLEPMEALIAEVIEIHPEYHALFEDGETLEQREFTPEQGQTNPFLHMGMHIALREQATSDRPEGLQSLYQKLCASKGRHEAEHAMMECLGEALWSAQRNGREPDMGAYLGCLKKL
ncbi:MAG: DUF1841 family protein [Gammaproteobacteria bacterium]|nr:DUF1841 family protein [Gammaproteobacteria bacterium]